MFPNKKYENMFNIISKTNENIELIILILICCLFKQILMPQTTENNEQKWNNQPDADSMKNELKKFFKKTI